MGRRIREARKAKNLTLEDLAKECGVTTGTISKIERAENGYRATDKILESIARRLGTTADNLKNGTGNYKIGFGGCLWAAPLLHLSLGEKVSPRISLTYSRKDGIPIYYPQALVAQSEMENENAAETTSKNRNSHLMIAKELEAGREEAAETNSMSPELMTAKELTEDLTARQLDMVFLPEAAHNSSKYSLSRICRITQTVEGGLYMIGVPLNGGEYAEQVFLEKDHHILLLYGEDTIADTAAGMLADMADCEKVTLSPIGINRKDQLIKSFSDSISNGANSEYDFVCFIGWQPQISYIQTSLQGKTAHFKQCINDLFQFISKHKDGRVREAFTVSFDGFIMSDQLESFRQNQELKSFFFELNDAINDLNNKKRRKRTAFYHEAIAKRLDMGEQETQDELYRTSFELTFPIDAFYNR